jgi:hypothetical protein
VRLRSLVLCVCFVDRCLSFCTFSFDHCVVYSSNLHSDTIWAAVAFDPSQSYVNSLPDDVLYDLRVARLYPEARWNVVGYYFLIASVYPEDMPYGCTLQQINCHDSKYRGSFGFPRLNGNRQFKKKIPIIMTVRGKGKFKYKACL